MERAMSLFRTSAPSAGATPSPPAPAPVDAPLPPSLPAATPVRQEKQEDLWVDARLDVAVQSLVLPAEIQESKVYCTVRNGHFPLHLHLPPHLPPLLPPS